MRKTFICILASMNSDVNIKNLEKAQDVLSYSDSRVNQRYIDAVQLEYDKARSIVSDFVLGKTYIDKLRTSYDNNGVYDTLKRVAEKYDTSDD